MDDRGLVVGVDGRELQDRPTGTGRYLRSLLRHWRETGDQLIVYFRGTPPEDPILEHAAICRRSIGESGARGLLWEQRTLPAAAARDRLDVFFSPAYSCPLALAVPRVTTVHDLSFYSHPQDFTFHDALRRRVLTGLSVAASGAVLAVSDFTRRELAARFPAAAERVRHVPHGPDDDLPAPPSREEARQSLGVSGPLLITVGSVLNRRCLPELLRAVARLVARHPGLVLDVVGENRTHPPLDLPARVAGLGLGDTVRLSGFVDDAALARRYAAADAAVFLSEYEGFGLPALEAAARGIPLVVSTAPALGEIFGPVALQVPPRAETEVARALDRILTERGLRERLVSAGHLLAARYSWEQATRLTREACREAAGR